MKLTEKQKNIFDYIRNYLSDKGYSPTYEEIKEFFGFKSIRSVQQYLESLASKKLIRLGKSNEKRAIKLTPSRYDEFYRARSLLPSIGFMTDDGGGRLLMMGRVAAGYPIEAIENPEEIDVPPSMFKRKNDSFVLQVVGDSMRDEGILDGDHIIVRKQKEARNGEIVVAMIDQEATVKTFFRRRSQIELRPANPDFEPIVVGPSQNFELIGVVVGLMRHFT